jgi:hypothetical protein
VTTIPRGIVTSASWSTAGRQRTMEVTLEGTVAW